MKKIIQNILLVLGLVFLSHHQSVSQILQILEAAKPQQAFKGKPILTKKSSVLSFSIGVPNNLSSFLSLGGISSFVPGTNSSKSGVGPISAHYEYLIKSNLGIGASLSYATATQNYSNSIIGLPNVTGKISGVSVTFSTIYHYYITDKLDPYLRGSIGLNIWKGSYNYDNGTQAQSFTAPTPIGYNAVVGLRYFVNDKFAPFGELGMGSFKLTANIGCAFKMK